jgi:hypothetical protein
MRLPGPTPLSLYAMSDGGNAEREIGTIPARVVHASCVGFHPANDFFSALRNSRAEAVLRPPPERGTPRNRVLSGFSRAFQGFQKTLPLGEAALAFVSEREIHGAAGHA